MTKTEELLKLADAATPGPWSIEWYICHEGEKELWRVPKSIGPICPEENHWARDHLGISKKDAAFISAANPATIKELCIRQQKLEELCRTQHELILEYSGYNTREEIRRKSVVAMFDAFEKG